MTGPPDSAGTVKPRTPAETSGKDANMDGNWDTVESMVLLGPHYGKQFSSR